MKFSKQVTEYVTKIMGVEEEMIRLLPQLEDKLNLLNPWVRQLPGIFRGLKLKPSQIVLDMPCGKGGVSVPLAKKFGVKVIGFDVIEAYVKRANFLASQAKIDHRCAFQAGDIRAITKRKNICDILLWIAPPHIWKTSAETIKNLRNCVKNSGRILIADAYSYKKTKRYKDYESLKLVNKSFTAFGDEIIKFIDYGDKLWDEDYDRAKKSANKALEQAKDLDDKKIINRYLKSLSEDEKFDKKYLGLGIWIVQIKK